MAAHGQALPNLCAASACALRPPGPQRYAAARWLADLEPQHPRPSFFVGVWGAMGFMLPPGQLAAARRGSAVQFHATLINSWVPHGLEGLRAARQAQSLFWEARLGYELFNYVSDFVGESAGPTRLGLPPTEAARVLSSADAALRAIQAAGLLPMEWTEVRPSGMRWAGAPPASRPLRARGGAEPLPTLCSRRALQYLRQQRETAKKVRPSCTVLCTGRPLRCMAQQSLQNGLHTAGRWGEPPESDPSRSGVPSPLP